MENVKIIDYNLADAKPADYIALNTGRNCSLRILKISGINGQTLKLKISNDGVNWEYVKNEAGDADYTVTQDTSIPLVMSDALLAIESSTNADGIIATIGIKRK